VDKCLVARRQCLGFLEDQRGIAIRDRAGAGLGDQELELLGGVRVTLTELAAAAESLGSADAPWSGASLSGIIGYPPQVRSVAAAALTTMTSVAQTWLAGAANCQLHGRISSGSLYRCMSSRRSSFPVAV